MHLKKIWAVIYAVMLAAFSTFVLLDAFVIPKDRIKADEPIQSQENYGDKTKNVCRQGCGYCGMHI